MVEDYFDWMNREKRPEEQVKPIEPEKDPWAGVRPSREIQVKEHDPSDSQMVRILDLFKRFRR